METYIVEFSKEVVAKNLARLRKQIWKLLPMKENGEDWIKQLNSVKTRNCWYERNFLK